MPGCPLTDVKKKKIVRSQIVSFSQNLHKRLPPPDNKKPLRHLPILLKNLTWDCSLKHKHSQNATFTLQTAASSSLQAKNTTISQFKQWFQNCCFKKMGSRLLSFWSTTTNGLVRNKEKDTGIPQLVKEMISTGHFDYILIILLLNWPQKIQKWSNRVSISVNGP